MICIEMKISLSVKPRAHFSGVATFNFVNFIRKGSKCAKKTEFGGDRTMFKGEQVASQLLPPPGTSCSTGLGHQMPLGVWFLNESAIFVPVPEFKPFVHIVL